MGKCSRKQQQWSSSTVFLSAFVEFTMSDIQKTRKAAMLFTLDVVHLQHPRLLQH
jgi:hypothetical protein